MPVPPATQAAPSAERFPLLRRVLDLRTRELEAWTAFGYKVGQSMSAMGIANVHFMTQQLDTLQLTDTLEQASTWYARADAYLEGENSPAALAQRQTVCANGSSSRPACFCTKRCACAASSTLRITMAVWAQQSACTSPRATRCACMQLAHRLRYT